MADDFTILNPGVGGDTMDEIACTHPIAPLIRKRPKVVMTGAGTDEIAIVSNSPPSVTDYGLATRNIENKFSNSVTHSEGGIVSNITLSISNPNRMGITIYNDSIANLYIKFGATASISDYTLKMEPYSYYEMIPFHYTGIVDAVWDSATGFARITELT